VDPGQKRTLPSWVPDWSSGVEDVGLEVELFHIQFFGSSGREQGQAMEAQFEISENGQVLTLHGNLLRSQRKQRQCY
jgi:hypothetical protein